jgi:hypothetical protein
LVIAVDNYQDPGLSQLRSPAQDAAALSAVLGDPSIGGFGVEVVSNQPSHVVQARIEDFFVDAIPSDLLVLHFSCHGLKSEAGDLFFAATNTRPTRLGSTAIAADFVQRCMRASRSRSVVLFLDCCYGGAFSQGATVRASGSLDVLSSFPGEPSGVHGRGRAVITASSSMEYAFEGEQLAGEQQRRPSVFTTALVEGLRTGDADRDEDGRVSLNELYDYLFERVRDANPHQTPGRNVDLQGEIYLAKSRRRRIQPRPLPADLREAIADAKLFTRIGAITELRARLASQDLEIARAAVDALQSMAHHDIQQVITIARAALTEAALVPSEAQISFGELPHGSTSPEYSVRLLGPPIARIAVSHSAPGWVRVRQDDEGLYVSVDTTSATASYTGELVIEGATGQAVVQLDATIQTPSQPLPSFLPAQATNTMPPASTTLPNVGTGLRAAREQAPEGSPGGPVIQQISSPDRPGVTGTSPGLTRQWPPAQPAWLTGDTAHTAASPTPRVRTHLLLCWLILPLCLYPFVLPVLPWLGAVIYATRVRKLLRQEGRRDPAAAAAAVAAKWLWATGATWLAVMIILIASR